MTCVSHLFVAIRTAHVVHFLRLQYLILSPRTSSPRKDDVLASVANTCVASVLSPLATEDICFGDLMHFPAFLASPFFPNSFITPTTSVCSSRFPGIATSLWTTFFPSLGRGRLLAAIDRRPPSTLSSVWLWTPFSCLEASLALAQSGEHSYKQIKGLRKLKHSIKIVKSKSLTENKTWPR